MTVCQTSFKFDQGYSENNSKRWGSTFMKWKLIDNSTKIQWYIKRDGVGWIGLGFGDGMKDSDWVFINKNVTNDYIPMLRDCSFKDRVAKCNETDQLWTLASTNPPSYDSWDKQLEIEIVRPLTGKGKDDDKNLGMGTEEWTWAVGSDYLMTDGLPTNKHGFGADSRGRFQVTLASNGALIMMKAGIAMVAILFVLL